MSNNGKRVAWVTGGGSGIGEVRRGSAGGGRLDGGGFGPPQG